MRGKIRVYLFLALSLILLSACDERDEPEYIHDRAYVGSGDFDIVYYDFLPHQTYRVKLVTYSGDADIAIYNIYGEQVVFSNEYSRDLDEVIFTAENMEYEIEIYGNSGSEYQLYIEELTEQQTGLYTEFDGVEFEIDSASFSGELYTVLASRSIDVSHNYTNLTITSTDDPIWLDVTPTGTIYSRNISFSINVLETEFPATVNYATVLLQAEDGDGKVKVFKELDVVYRLIN